LQGPYLALKGQNVTIVSFGIGIDHMHWKPA